jgi:4-hydroxy-tetrahydrodipicolinate reductase
METPVRVLLVGAAGRMGQAITRAAEDVADIEIQARANRGDAIEDAVSGCDVVIDFSHADATERNCAAAVTSGKPIVIGTTGHSSAQLGIIEKTAQRVPVILAANFSVGVNTLFWLSRRAAELLGDSFDIEIVETHHRLKKDAPSGTAKRLAQLLAEARRLSYAENVAHGREGQVGERPANEIGVHAIRAGDVVGEHTVMFAGSGERLELTHKASSRDTFAVGALRAALWVVGQPAALYSMEDVLGLSACE